MKNNKIINIPALIFILLSIHLWGHLMANDNLNKLIIFQNNYPKVFFFRFHSEGFIRHKGVNYEEWEPVVSQLMGIEGKVLNEEVATHTEKIINSFVRFKKDHPRQMVLLHFNGNARDFNYDSSKYFAGHFLYYNGSVNTKAIPEESGETEIQIKNPGVFDLYKGRYKKSTDDIGICLLDKKGKPNWYISEQVKLISIDRKNKTIRVKRGMYGTKPLAFPEGKAYIAVHKSEGPWGEKSNQMWYYNFSTKSPKDKKGKQCLDILAEELITKFKKGGSLEYFDGIQFDVLIHDRAHTHKRQAKLDCDADGEPDNGIFKGINTYGVGVYKFIEKLRKGLGNDKLIMADGHSGRHQRAFKLLNGIESEGWPDLRDHYIKDWSGGMNRHYFWRDNSAKPVFNYINHKFMESGDNAGERVPAKIPFNITRLVFAAGVFTDSALCNSLQPTAGRTGKYEIWDEFIMGEEKKLGWLGKPITPSIHLAERSPDILEGRANPIQKDFTKYIERGNCSMTINNKKIILKAKKSKQTNIVFYLKNIPCNNKNLTIVLEAEAEPMLKYPKEIARLMHVELLNPGDKIEQPVFMTWINKRAFKSRFSYSGLNKKTTDLKITVEHNDPVYLSGITIHHYPDVVYREFENGFVLANPSLYPYTFNLSKLFPGKKYRRLKGTENQDQKTNNGKEVSGEITLQSKDAIFLYTRI